MRIITGQECREWLRGKFSKEFTWDSAAEIYPNSATYSLPVDTGKKTGLARQLTGSLDMRAPGLFWITCWGVFPSAENMALFDGYRKSLGESRGVYDAPGHILDEADSQQLECLFDLALYFYWDASIFDGAGSVAVQTSNDEWFSVYTKDQARLQEIESSCRLLKLWRMTP
jgi:hypothetical protein